MLRVALKTLLGHKLRLLMSTFAIVLGVGFVAGTLIFSDTLNRSFTSIFASTVGDVVVRPDGGVAGDGSPSTVTIPSDLVAELAEVDGAARADGNVSAVGVFVIDDRGKPLGGGGPPAIGASWGDAPAGHGITGLVIADGRAPTGADEVVLDAATARKSGYELGDEVTINTIFTRAVIHPVLVGTAEFGEGGSLNGATLAAFETGEAQRLFLEGKDAFNDIWVTAEDGVTQEQLRDRVAAELPVGLEAVTGDEAAEEQGADLLDAISFITKFLLIFAAIALIVGSFLIVNTFSILVAQRSRELALLRALGASRRQVRRLVSIEALAISLLGSTLGLAFGFVLFLGIRAGFNQFLGLDLRGTPMVLEWRTPVAAYVVGVAVTVLAAHIPARRTSRISPVQAMRDDVALPESTLRRRLLLGSAGILAGATAIGLALFGEVPQSGYVLGLGALMVLLGVTALAPTIAHPFLVLTRRVFGAGFGMVGHLAGQNALRNPRRTAATASALMIGLTLCTTMAIAGSSAKASVDASVKRNFVGDFAVSSVFGLPFSPSVADRVAEIPGVATVNRIRMQYVAGSFHTTVQAVDPATVTEGLRISMKEGDLDDLEDGTVMVSGERAEDDGLELGDEIEIDLPAGRQTWRLVGIYRVNPILGDGYVTTFGSYAAAGFQPSDNLVVADLEDGADRAAVREAMEEATAEQPMISVTDQDGLAKETSEPIDQVLGLIYALLALALVIAVLGVVNTLALSVIERTREIGLLRALGLGRRQLRTMIRLESIVIAVLGALLGVGLGLVFGIVLMKDLASSGLEVVSVPVGQLGTFLAVAVVVGVLAAVLPARRAARLDVLRAIATE